MGGHLLASIVAMIQDMHAMHAICMLHASCLPC